MNLERSSTSMPVLAGGQISVVAVVDATGAALDMVRARRRSSIEMRHNFPKAMALFKGSELSQARAAAAAKAREIGQSELQREMEQIARENARATSAIRCGACRPRCRQSSTSENSATSITNVLDLHVTGRILVKFAPFIRLLTERPTTARSSRRGWMTWRRR